MQGVWQGGGDVVDGLGMVGGLEGVDGLGMVVVLDGVVVLGWVDGYRRDDLYGLTEDEITIVEGIR